MKTLRIVSILGACAVLCLACNPIANTNVIDNNQHPDSVIRPDSIPSDTIPYQSGDSEVIPPPAADSVIIFNDSLADRASMMLVKFTAPEGKDFVIVGHPIWDYDGIEGQFLYKEDGILTLNCPENQTNMNLSYDQVYFLVEHTDIIGTSPFIPLADNYYLIDWRWQLLLPLSALTNYANKNAYHDQLYEHVKYHVFATSDQWSSLTDLTKQWTQEQAYDLPIKEIWRVGYRKIDELYDDIKVGDPYICYNMSLYSDGLSSVNAWLYYRGDGGSLCNPEGRYLSYLAYCDSMQNVYRERLIEMINNKLIK